MNGIDIKVQKPAIGRSLYFSENEDMSDPLLGTYESERWCMLGKPNGSCGEGFQDDYNKLPCDGTYWIYEEHFITP